MDQYQQILLSLTAKAEVSLATLIEGISLLTPTLQVNKGTKYQQILLSLTAKPEVSLATLIEGISLLTPTLQVNQGTIPRVSGYP